LTASRPGKGGGAGTGTATPAGEVSPEGNMVTSTPGTTKDGVAVIFLVRGRFYSRDLVVLCPSKP
jgi:hypothetical protein